jgi:hypothetical protein
MLLYRFVFMPWNKRRAGIVLISLLIYCEISGSHSGAGMWVRVVGWVCPDVSKECSAFIFRVKWSLWINFLRFVETSGISSPTTQRTSLFISLRLAHTCYAVLSKHTVGDPALKLSRQRNMGISVTGTPHLVVKLIANTMVIYVT